MTSYFLKASQFPLASVCLQLRYSSGRGSGSRSMSFQKNSNPSPKLQFQLERVPHMNDFFPNVPSHPNPLIHNRHFHALMNGFFVHDTDMVARQVAIDTSDPTSQTHAYFPRAGPRERVIYKPEDVKAAIVTCGGLCPGMNAVIRELVIGLWYQYGVRDVQGIQAGYRGFYSMEWVPLSPKVVDHWHKIGGTVLGTSRGGFDLEKIISSIEKSCCNVIFIIGGDGTLRGALKIMDEVTRKGLRVTIACIPKTVDNDVGIIDRSFGFQTAVEAAQAAINAAHVEAESTPNGVGLVKLMGRYSGHIALDATLSSRDVDCCLIPEVPFFLHGEGGLLEFMEQRLKANGHAVIVMAEGAGQDLIPREGENSIDDSGNVANLDIGPWLSKQLKQWWKEKYPDRLFTVKYIDPTYMVRAIPSNATDTIYCTLLAHSTIHGAMAGYTGFVGGVVNGNYCYIPLDQVAQAKHFVNVNDHTWAWVRSVSNQPDFIKPALHATTIDG
ncbi:hypothetical protein O6H91_17G077200 [Diphasiastrum complanatum]|uniref:Uncharacterized protein n=1 Tax=Diphasiastrum complanatum TaxID=34168 RepID=A0ACC2B875_DIPCM|nr:hypothetical protein O6H91_17G077200 [Diphasiastrum complanatum]